MSTRAAIRRSPSDERHPVLAALLNGLPRVSAEQLESCALLRRVDTKFLLKAQGLGDFIEALNGEYGLLSADGQPIASYRTLYFDTPAMRFFYQHHRGRRARYKVRIRHYLDRKLSTLEVKRKTNHNVTHKVRREKSFLDNWLGQADRRFIGQHISIDPAVIKPHIWTNFSRITLVNLRDQERMTIDLGLEFESDGRRRRLEHLAIVEVKQPGFAPRSAAMLALRGLGLRPSSASKYCTATATLFPQVRHNRLRPTLRKIWRLSHA